MGNKWENPPWIVELSKRFNAALRHSAWLRQRQSKHRGLPCDEAGWVNVESILKYDAIGKTNILWLERPTSTTRYLLRDGTTSRE